MSHKKTHEQFVQELKLIQPEIIVIDTYINGDTNLKVKCKLGIIYLVRPVNLLRNVKPSIKSAIDKHLCFKLKIKNLFPNLKIISKYINSSTKILVQDENNIYNANPESLIQGKYPRITTCPNKNIPFIISANKIHNNFYNYDKLNYISCHENVIITCPIHGDFKQKPSIHLNGHGCYKCAVENRPGGMCSVFKHQPNYKTFIYFFRCYNDNEEFYKIGLSINPKKRTYQIPYKIDILGSSFGEVKDLYPLEQAYHKKFKEMKINYKPDIFFEGYTECFK